MCKKNCNKKPCDMFIYLSLAHLRLSRRRRRRAAPAKFRCVRACARPACVNAILSVCV